MELDYFSSLCQHLQVAPDRRGECHVSCPSCGHPVKRGQTHFSFSRDGAFCFVCGYDSGLRALAAHYGLADGMPVERRPLPPRPEARHYNIREHAPDELAVRYAAHPERMQRWQAYKPVNADTIKRYRLGFGALPAHSSRCPHRRLIVPLFEAGTCVGFRARQVECECGKWLSPGGSQLTLYNARDLAGKLVWIVENPIDALLIEQRYPECAAVATLGVSVWRDEWTELVRPARKVIVAYDHDCPGNGGTAAMRQAWLRTHPRLPEPGGIKLVNRLLSAGIMALLFPWPADAPEHADIGSVLCAS